MTALQTIPFRVSDFNLVQRELEVRVFADGRALTARIYEDGTQINGPCYSVSYEVAADMQREWQESTIEALAKLAREDIVFGVVPLPPK